MALAKASQPNKVVSIELKGKMDEGVFGLFLTDECARYKMYNRARNQDQTGQRRDRGHRIQLGSQWTRMAI